MKLTLEQLFPQTSQEPTPSASARAKAEPDTIVYSTAPADQPRTRPEKKPPNGHALALQGLPRPCSFEEDWSNGRS